jgi:hypothetical protein
VVTELKDIVAINIDAESKDGAKVAEQFGIKGYPALFVLESDGKIRDQIGGYLKPEDFKREIRRVRSDEGTVGGLRRKVTADPKNTEARWRLVEKLRAVGDAGGAKAEVAEIEKLDPEGKTLGMRHVLFERVIDRIDQGWQKDQSLDTAELERFLAEEKYPEIQFDGWQRMYAMRSYQAQKSQEPERAKSLRAEARAFLDKAWKQCAEKDRAGFGPALVAILWKDRAELGEGERKLALEIADKAVAAAGEDAADAIAAKARALHINGRKEEALVQVERCVTLDPKNQAWVKLREEITSS